MTPVATESSVLVSSSAYLNHTPLREWFSTELLRKNGKDRRPISDNTPLNRALADIRDNALVDAMFERDRKLSPALDRWMTEKFYSTFTVEDLATCPPDSVGGIYYNYIQGGIELDIGFALDSRNWYEYAIVRYSRNHDFEHILTGGPFTFPGEYAPLFAMITNTHNYMSPDLAAFIGMRSALGSLRFLSRAVLHYPGSVAACLDAIALGIEVGLASDPIRLIKVEDVLRLPLEAAREKLGIRGAYDLPAEPGGSAWLDPFDAEAIAADSHLPYIKRGMRKVATASSVLVSSSKYMNDVRLRDWTATAMLRKCGADYPDAEEEARLEVILDPLRDTVGFNARAEVARRANPVLNRLLTERPTLDAGAFAAAPAGSVGARLTQRGLPHSLAIGDDAWSYLSARAQAAEAVLAVLFEGRGDPLEEIMPGWAMAAALANHLEADLAGELNIGRVLSLQRFIARTQLHYPESWIAIARAMRQGIATGKAAPPLYAMDFTAIAALSPAEARARLGIADWTAVDTRAASAAYGAA